MEELKSRINPVKILSFWAILLMALTPIFMFVSNIGASGGEQKPLTTLAIMFNVAIYGTAIFSILVPFLFRKWFSKNGWFVFIILLILIPVLIDIWGKCSQSHYSSSEINTNVNGNKMKKKIEYYDNFKTIRSISIWKNNKRDSVWKIFSTKGEIISQQTYSNDTLLKK